jgi:streptomycin 6-kinase
MSDLGPVNPGQRADLAWLTRWRLRPEGDVVTTPTSALMAVRTDDGVAAVLKVAHDDEEARGADLLELLEGRGVATVLRRDGAALLLERATGPRDLVSMVDAGEDDAATRILCDVAQRVHAETPRVLGLAEPPPLVELETWFRHLFAHADGLGPVHRAGAELAHRRLAEQRRPVVLHGDLHHANVLDFGERGWLAIDPKGLVGDAEFDVCNVLCNPSHAHALLPGRLERQFAVVLAATGFDPRRLRDWLVAWCALSSTWFALDDDPAASDALALLGQRAAGLVP